MGNSGGGVGACEDAQGGRGSWRGGRRPGLMLRERREMEGDGFMS